MATVESSPEEVRFAQVFAECMDVGEAQAFNAALAAFLEHGVCAQ